MVLGLSLYSSQSPWWYSGYSYTHQSLPGGIQTIHILITVSLVVVRLSIYSSQYYPYNHHGLPPGTQTIPVLNRVSLVVLRLFLYSSQSPWCYSDYPYTHHSFPGSSNYPFIKHSLPGGTHTIPMLIQSTWW